jgi:hypothetical protein
VTGAISSALDEEMSSVRARTWRLLGATSPQIVWNGFADRSQMPNGAGRDNEMAHGAAKIIGRKAPARRTVGSMESENRRGRPGNDFLIADNL